MTDSFPETLVSAVITAIASGAAGEIGKQAWDSLTKLMHKASRRRSPRNADFDEIATAPTSAGDTGRLVALLASIANEDPEFNEALNSWAMRARHDLKIELGDDSTVNIIERADTARVNSIIQARSIHGDLHIHEGSGPATAPIPRQLPLVSRYFVGRSPELEILDGLLREDSARSTPISIATIDGPGGIGKTTLALQWAHRATDRKFADGQLFVDMCGYHISSSPLEPSEALQGFLEALGVPSTSIPASLAFKASLFRSVVAQKRLLIILDNVFSAEQVQPLLPGSPTCKTIITSRNKLTDLVVEHGALPISLNLFSRAESLSMIADRIGQARVDAEADGATRLVELCARLPLALAIASARLYLQPQYTIQSIAKDIESAGSRVRGLASISSKDVNAVSSSSYSRLSTDAAMLFRLISLFPGPDISLHAVASLAGQRPSRTREILTELTQASLIEEPYPGRYQFHDLLREYAVQEAANSDSAESRRDALDRLFNFYIESAVRADRYIHPFRDPVAIDPILPGVTVVQVGGYEQAFQWFDAEQSTLVNIIKLAASESRWSSAWQLAWACSTYFDRTGRWEQWAITQEIALNAALHLSDRRAAARSRRLLANIYDHLEQPSQALPHAELALADFRELGDASGEARTSRTLSSIYSRLGSYRLALEGADRAMRIYSELDDDYGVANSLSALCAVEGSIADYAAAQDHGEAAVSIFQRLGERYSLVVALRRLAHVYAARGRSESAIVYQLRALEASQALGNRYLEAALLEDLGDSYRAVGNVDEARTALRRGLSFAQSIGAPNARELEAKLTDLDSEE